jgi:2-C-methyl-D-erythritol 2,4-cyclodiphosphate synthase
MYRTGIGQDSHSFEDSSVKKPLIVGGIHIPGAEGLKGNSDADVVLHALTNAISSITGTNILGRISDEMCLVQGIRDSAAYLAKAVEYLGNYRIVHVSIAIEGRKPKFEPHIDAMKKTIAGLLNLKPSEVGITATTGEGLTAFGRSEGLQAFAIVTATDETICSR